MTLRQAIRMAESSRELHLRIFRMIGYVLSAELEKICSLLLKNKKCSGAPSHVSSGRGAFYLIFPLCNIWKEFTIRGELLNTVKRIFEMEEQQHLFKDTFLAAVLDQMDTNFYITDVETDEILYMNKTMKETFGLARPEGCICWQVLQKDMKERCPYCKIRQLEQMEDNRICIWRETNSVTGRKYRNYDSLIQWKGKVYHIQNSVDMTEFDQISETARTDELTRMLNRRGGGERLRQALEQGGRENQVVTVVLYDINELKAVNDRYGHSEGTGFFSMWQP